jgi:hypothetical protein
MLLALVQTVWVNNSRWINGGEGWFFSDLVAFPLPSTQAWVLAHTGVASIDYLEMLGCLLPPKILFGGWRMGLALWGYRLV